MKNNHIINRIDREFRDYLLAFIQKELNNFKYLPIEKYDVYNLFLAKTPDLMKEYDETKSNFKTFIRNSCYFHIKNTIRFYNKKNFIVLNEANRYSENIEKDNKMELSSFSTDDEVDVSDEEVEGIQESAKIFSIYETQTSEKLFFDENELYSDLFKTLNVVEQLYFNLYFIEKFSMNQIEEMLNITYFRSKKLLSSIKEKMSKF